MIGFTLPIRQQLELVENLMKRAEIAIIEAPEGTLVIGSKGNTQE